MDATDSFTTYDFEFAMPQIPQPVGTYRLDGQPIGVQCRVYFRDERSVEATCWGRANVSITVSRM